tara:strand:+ start:22845 stop:24443 length:1599 start_codon:yes stop_codon:yes gene_type:complete
VAYKYERETVLTQTSAMFNQSVVDVSITQSGLRVTSDSSQLFDGIKAYALRCVDGKLLTPINADEIIAATDLDDMSTMGGSVKTGDIDTIPTSYFTYQTGANILEKEFVHQDNQIDTYITKLKGKLNETDLATADTRVKYDAFVKKYNTHVRLLTSHYGFHTIPSTPTEHSGYHLHAENSQIPFRGKTNCFGFTYTHSIPDEPNEDLRVVTHPIKTPHGTYWSPSGEATFNLVYAHDGTFLPFPGMLKSINYTDSDNVRVEFFNYDIPRLHTAYDKLAEIHKALSRIYLRSKFADTNLNAEKILNYTFIQNCAEWSTIEEHKTLAEVQSWVSSQHVKNGTSHGIARKWQYFFMIAGIIPENIPAGGGLTTTMGPINHGDGDYTYILESFSVTDADGGEICLNGELVVMPSTIYTELDELDITEYAEYVADMQYSAEEKNMMNDPDVWPQDRGPINHDELRTRIGQGFQRLAQKQQQNQQVHDIGYTEDDDSGGWSLPSWRGEFFRITWQSEGEHPLDGRLIEFGIGPVDIID